MSRRPSRSPERGEARARLLDAARERIRMNGYNATTIDDLCRAAEVTKGAFFHHFASKEDLGLAAAHQWAEDSSAVFEGAPYHLPDDPADRLLAYVAFRRSLIAGEIHSFTCLTGTMAAEVYRSSPAIRDACGDCILGHAATLVGDIRAAMAARGMADDGAAESLARHTQAVVQGAFVLAKAANDPALARESLDHLDRYIRLLFAIPLPETST